MQVSVYLGGLICYVYVKRKVLYVPCSIIKRHSIYRPEIPIFNSLYSGEGKFEYRSCYSTERRGHRLQSIDPDWHLASLAGEDVLVSMFCSVLEAY
jgi:hypothetical protein